MINPANIRSIYLIGIGGIGMSALARYFNSNGFSVSGYDRVSTSLTDQLINEGISVYFYENTERLKKNFPDSNSCLVIYTPAIPQSNAEYQFFKTNNFNMLKRSEVLGAIISDKRGIAISGTHGKTSVSTMLAEIMTKSEKGCNAFLGGISKNYNSNLLLNKNSDFFVVEADEFDRSFLKLFPEIALVTSIDPDHLDIYGDYNILKKGFEKFLSQVNKEGIIIIKKGLDVHRPDGVKCYTYHIDDPGADFYAKDIINEGFRYTFSFVTPGRIYKSFQLGVYGKVNLENAIAALAIAWSMDVDEGILRQGIADFRGVKRRFDVKIEKDNLLFIDDYAHHPEEIRAFLTSVREVLPGKELTGIFQPHLYSRTRDFAAQFAESLSVLDHVILLDIYPAREEPIPGVDSKMIFKGLSNNGDRILCNKSQVLKIVGERKPDVLLTMGAGDIDQLVDGIKSVLER